MANIISHTCFLPFPNVRIALNDGEATIGIRLDDHFFKFILYISTMDVFVIVGLDVTDAIQLSN